MSLSFRLNLYISLLFVLVLLFGTWLVIANARKAVAQEIEASANLVLQLVTAVTISTETPDRANLQAALIRNLSELDDVRHLNVALVGSDVSPSTPPERDDSLTDARAPVWFAHLVSPAPIEYRRRLTGPDVPYAEIVIRPDPSDEISEAWQESRVVLGLLVLFAALAMGLVYLIISRALKPVDQILDALTIIEGGDFSARLPEFQLPELGRLARQFNHMAEVLETQRRENRELTKRSLAIQESERRHLARELHDELGQSISAIKAVAVSIGRNPEVADSPLRANTESIISICNHIYEVVRVMMNRLRPTVLDELGLQTALERTIDDWNAHHDTVFCRLSTTAGLEPLGEETRIGVYRMVQECLTNVARHAKASKVDVRLEITNTEPSRLVLRVSDDGIGFDPQQVSGGLGLLGIRERAEALGGEAQINTAPNAGVEVAVSIPLDIEMLEGDAA